MDAARAGAGPGHPRCARATRRHPRLRERAADAAGAVALVVLRARDPRFIAALRQEEVRGAWALLHQRAEHLRRDLDPATTEQLDRLAAACHRLMTFARDPASLVLSPYDVVTLLGHCLRLTELRHQIFTLFRSTPVEEAERGLAELRRQRDEVADAAARTLFDEAILHKQAEIDSYRSMQRAVARIDGQLAAAVCALESFVARLQSLRIADTTARTLSDPALAEELGRLTANLQALEASLEETLAVGSRR